MMRELIRMPRALDGGGCVVHSLHVCLFIYLFFLGGDKTFLALVSSVMCFSDDSVFCFPWHLR